MWSLSDLDLDGGELLQVERVPHAVDLEPAGDEVAHGAARVLEDVAGGVDARRQRAAGVLDLALVDLALRLQLDAVRAAALAGDLEAVGLVDLLENVEAARVIEQPRDGVVDDLCRRNCRAHGTGSPVVLWRHNNRQYEG